MSVFGPLPRAEYVEDRVAIENTRPLGFIVGLDLGKSQDFTALVVNDLQASDRVRYVRTKFDPKLGEINCRPVLRHRLVSLHRYQKGTSYPEINRSVQGILSQLPGRPRAPALVVDGTGVGAPVVDAMRELGMRPVSLIITGGNEITNTSATSANVPKRLLASAIDITLAEDRLDITAGAGASEQLRSELQAFRVKIRTTGNVAMEAARETDHDDLVLAAAMAVWWGETRPAPAKWTYFNKFRL